MSFPSKDSRSTSNDSETERRGTSPSPPTPPFHPMHNDVLVLCDKYDTLSSWASSQCASAAGTPGGMFMGLMSR